MLQMGTLFSRYKNRSTWKNSMPIWDVQSVAGEFSTVSSSITVEVAVILTLQRYWVTIGGHSPPPRAANQENYINQSMI